MTLEYMCAYCGNAITDGMAAHTVVIADITTNAFIQQWYAHQACFRNALHPNARVFKSEHEEEDEWESVE